MGNYPVYLPPGSSGGSSTDSSTSTPTGDQSTSDDPQDDGPCDPFYQPCPGQDQWFYGSDYEEQQHYEEMSKSNTECDIEIENEDNCFRDDYGMWWYKKRRILSNPFMKRKP